MFDDAMACFLAVFLITSSLATDSAMASETSQALVAADGAGIGPIPRPELVPPPSASDMETVSLDGAQFPGVLREIGQRQTELTILELDLKRAELQKKLRELELAAHANGPQFLPAAASLASPMSPAAVPMGREGQPYVRRIHKVGDEIAALVVFSDGVTKNISVGGLVGNGVRIVEILPDTVYVRQGDRERYALPVFQARHGVP